MYWLATSVHFDNRSALLIVLSKPEVESVFNFSNVTHLIGRHPAVLDNRRFFAWLRTHGSKVWHETLNNNKYTVVAQSIDGLHLFAMEIERDEDETKPKRILRTSEVDVLETGMLKDH